MPSAFPSSSTHQRLKNSTFLTALTCPQQPSPAATVFVLTSTPPNPTTLSSSVGFSLFSLPATISSSRSSETACPSFSSTSKISYPTNPAKHTSTPLVTACLSTSCLGSSLIETLPTQNSDRTVPHSSTSGCLSNLRR